jgi:hypothetical protein
VTNYNTTCVVCGRISSRPSWNNTVTVGGNTYVACDFHSQDEINGAVQGVINTPGPDVVNQDPSIDESPQS